MQSSSSGRNLDAKVGVHCLQVRCDTVFTRIEAWASISFRDFVDPACKQGRLLFITLLSCTNVVMIFTCFHFR